MGDLILKIVQMLVENPKAVEVKELKGKQTTVYEILVPKEDRGRVVGKKGQNIGALKTLVNAIGRKSNLQLLLEIVD